MEAIAWLIDLLEGPVKNHNEIVLIDWLIDLIDGDPKNHNEIVVEDDSSGIDDEAMP